MTLLFQKPQHMQKIKYSFEQCSADGKNLFGMKVHIHITKAIKSFFSSIGLHSELFLNDLYYYYPELAEQQKQHECKMPFEDCLALIDYLISKKNSAKQNAELLESFKVFDKSANGVVNAGDLIPVMKKYLSQKEFQQFSQIITTSFGATINYLDAFKIVPGKHH